MSLSIADKYNLPLVASNDVLFLSDSDYEANEVKVSIIKKTKLDDKVNQTDYSSSQYFKSEDEMKTLFDEHESALRNVDNIIKRCNFKFPNFKYHLPKFSNPTNKDDSQYFRDLCKKGLNKYNSLHNLDLPKYNQRLDNEISVIQKMGFLQATF